MLAQMSFFPQGLLALILIFICGFLMLVILLQRGRGGGLTGAFGGAGGMSAFGAKTGDVFTWVTVVVATIFVLLSIVANFAFDESGTPTPAGVAEVKPTDVPTDGETPPISIKTTKVDVGTVPVPAVPPQGDGQSVTITGVDGQPKETPPASAEPAPKTEPAKSDSEGTKPDAPGSAEPSSPSPSGTSDQPKEKSPGSLEGETP